MKFRKLLHNKKPSIVKNWIRRTLDTYPSETSKFLKSKSDQFANPVGHTISNELEELFDGLVEGVESGRLAHCLDRVVRIRAVQDFTAAQAVEFIFYLKSALREEIGEEAIRNGHSEDMQALFAEIDALVLKGFDIYMECSKKLYEIRAQEAKNRMYMLLRRANMVQ